MGLANSSGGVLLAICLTTSACFAGGKSTQIVSSGNLEVSAGFVGIVIPSMVIKLKVTPSALLYTRSPSAVLPISVMKLKPEVPGVTLIGVPVPSVPDRLCTMLATFACSSGSSVAKLRYVLLLGGTGLPSAVALQPTAFSSSGGGFTVSAVGAQSCQFPLASL